MGRLKTNPWSGKGGDKPIVLRGMVGWGVRGKEQQMRQEVGGASYPSQSFFYGNHLLLHHHHQLNSLFVAHGNLASHIANVLPLVE